MTAAMTTSSTPSIIHLTKRLIAAYLIAAHLLKRK